MPSIGWINLLHYICLPYIWFPHQVGDINRLEMVQCHAARFVSTSFNRTASVTAMLNHLNWPTFEQRRNQAKLHKFYKIINSIISIPNDHLIQSSITTRDHSMRYIQLAARTNAYLHTFFPSTIRLLPDFQQTLITLNHSQFKCNYMYAILKFRVLYIA